MEQEWVTYISNNQGLWAKMYQEQQRKEKKEYNLKHLLSCRRWREKYKIKRKPIEV